MLKVENISKSFGGVKALHDVTIAFEAGKVHALCGENGAGKSTLMNVIVGNLNPDNGQAYWRGEATRIANVHEAQQKGIAIVYQEKSLVDSLSVAENIFPQNAPKTRFGLIDFGKLYKAAGALLDRLGMQGLPVRIPVARLSAAQKSMVEIAKALATNPSLLILDEPTASLTHKDTETLLQIIRQLKENGIAIIYITHRMKEIQEIADDVSVLKDGVYQGTFSVAQIATEELIRLMVGRELQQLQFASHVQEEIVLSVEGISGKSFRNVSFNLRKGEVLGFAGLEGSGRTAMATALFGDVALQAGSVRKNNKPLLIRHPADAIEHGIAYLPDDRKQSGLFIEKNLSENIIASQLRKGFYDQQHNDHIAENFKTSLNIKTPSLRQSVRKLSGGNQQKIVLAKWLALQPDVLIVNEPTHGVDVGAKAEIYSILSALTKKGKSIILISSDLPELLLLSDRIAVLYNGVIQDIVDKNQATEENITALASGIKHTHGA